jgi:hypothetical protein
MLFQAANILNPSCIRSIVNLAELVCSVVKKWTSDWNGALLSVEWSAELPTHLFGLQALDQRR